MNYYIDIDSIEEKLIYFEKELRLIDEKVDYLKKIVDEIEWEGSASLKFKEKFYKYLYELEDMKMGFLYYVKILSEFGNKYGHFYDEMERDFKNSINELESGLNG